MTGPTDDTGEWSIALTEEKPTIAKAIIAFVTALSATVLTALSDNGITATEWVIIATTSVVSALSVYAVTNKRT